jgi:hypothetical protein
MPLISRTFDQLIDFTRTSAATYVNSAGLVALTPPSVNLLTYTQEFDNPAWSKSNTTALPFNPATANYGPNVVVNGDFASATGWTASAGWVIGSGVATATTTSSSLYGGFTSVSGQWYKVTFDCTITAGTLALYIGGGNQANFTTGGAKTVFLQSGATTSRGIEFFGGAVSGTVDNVVVQAVTTNTGFITAPDGTMTGDLLAETTTNAGHTVSASATLITAPYALSVYLKKGTGATAPNWVQLYTGGTSTQYANFNLATGTVGNVAVGSTATITDVGNGWYRCALVFVPPAAGAAALAIAFTNNTDTTTRGPTYTGAATSDVFIWGAQLEAVPDANLVLGSELNVSTPPFTVFRDGVTNTPSPTLMTTTASRAYRVQLVISANTSTVTASFRVAGSSSGGAISPGQVGDNTYYTTGGSGGALVITGDTTGVNLTVTSVSVREITGTTAMPSAYAKNVGGLFPARFDYDPVTLAPRGILIEEQRSNSFTYSEQFDNAAWNKVNGTVGANATTSPDGTTNADAFVEDGTTSLHYVQQSIAFTSGVTYTLSVYIKPSTRAWLQLFFPASAFSGGIASYFNLAGAGALGATVGSVAGRSITAVGNGWYRVTLSAAATATTSGNVAIIPSAIDGSASYTGVNGATALFLYGAQLEAGAFATSYIPTVASTVTRTADVASVTAANFSSWYNQPRGTFVVDYDSFAATIPPSTKGLASANDNTGNNRVYGYLANNGAPTLLVTNGGATEANPLNSVISNNAITKSAWGYAANNFAIITNGGAAATDTSGTPPTAPNKLDIGHHLAGQQINGYIRSIRYYPARLGNAQLQTLTA